MMVAFLLILFAATLKPITHSYLPRCPTGSSLSPNKTRIYLAHSNEPLEQEEIDTIEEIVKYYPKCSIQITLYHAAEDNNLSETSSIIINSLRRKRDVVPTTKPTKETTEETTQQIKKNASTVYLLDYLIEEGRRRMNKRKIIVEKVTIKPKSHNLNDLLTRYDNIRCVHVSKQFIFENSPLFRVYQHFTPELTTFAIRILQLWDYGGISFALPDSHNIKSQHNDNDETNNIRKLVELGYDSFKKLDNGFVTIDEEGLHMETKTTCHAFFGEMLQYLRHATEETTSKEIVRQTLKSFCIRENVDSNYCKSLLST